MSSLVEVALPLPLFRTFTYEIGEEDVGRAVAGARVVVPFRNRKQLGIVLGPAEPPRTGVVVRRAIELPDDSPVVGDAVLSICRWIADYYAVPVGVALRTALPAALTGAADPTPAQKSRPVATLRQELPSLLHRERIFARSPKQRELFELLESLAGSAPVELLLERLRFTPSVLKGLVARGLAEVTAEVVSRDPFTTRPVPAPPGHTLTPAQHDVVGRLVAAEPGAQFLLHGVTGSGKTQVYIDLLREVVDVRGRSAIVLVPEIALTPQTVDRFRAVFGDRVAVLHSALSDGERYDAWLALRRGQKRIVVGARSAVFAPLTDLGAIVVDEEHEGSYKQGETPRYHARDVALMRGRREGAVVVLGTATPSLESWRNGQLGKLTVLSLPERVGGARLPEVVVVDRRQPSARAALAPNEPVDPFRLVFDPELEEALAAGLKREEQSILLLNRRGYASFIQCGACGFVETCPNCSISLTYHRAPERLICHYCLHERAPSSRCTKCDGQLLRYRGLGTQQVERLLAERFASARIARMDVDTTSARWAHAEILDRVGRREVDILLGTQMIAKGLDFPGVTLVGVVDADVGINLPDFRASERSFQLLSQVAGRAGRGSRGGRVIIQTRVPTHHAVRCAVTHDYVRFAGEELAGRREPVYPPYIRLANVVLSATMEAVAQRASESAVDWLRRLIADRAIDGVTLVGPAKCPVERIKNRWRWHFMVKAEQASALGAVGRFFMSRFEMPHAADLRITWDRDPVALL